MWVCFGVDAEESEGKWMGLDGVRDRKGKRGGHTMTMTLLSAWKLMHRYKLPSFFFTKRTRDPHGDLVGWIKPFCVCSSRNSRRAASSGGNKEYIRP